MDRHFRDRTDGGLHLASRLRQYARDPNTIVLALPRGGVPVGFVVARELELPLDVFLVRKLGLPEQEELAMGAIASGGTLIVNEDIVGPLEIPMATIQRVAARERSVLEQRERAYRGDRPPLDLDGRTVLLVDDGLATGTSMQAAIEGVRRYNPARIVVAVPVASRFSCDDVRTQVDEVVCVLVPEPFRAVGYWYIDFSPVSDADVMTLLNATIPRDHAAE